ncbi:MAG: hypothetical protein SPL17_10185 [Bacteroidales bacterium]|nr:hypothetical protein [Bacteroidales bacterium]
MKSQNKTRRFAKLFSQYLPSTMVFKCGLVLLIICTVAAFVIAYYHDAYSSILEMKELAATDVWFKLFVILMVLGAALLVGSPLLAMILAGISMLFPSKEPEMIEEQPAKETPVIKVEAPAVEEAAPGAKQPTSSSIDEARLRSLLNTPFMREISNGSSKTNLDRFIDDVKTVRIQHQKGVKDGFNDRSITSIAKILYSNKYQKQRPLPSFAEWNTTLFECLNLEAPQKGNINKSKDLDEQITKLFGYLIPSE